MSNLHPLGIPRRNDHVSIYNIRLEGMQHHTGLPEAYSTATSSQAHHTPDIHTFSNKIIITMVRIHKSTNISELQAHRIM